MFLYHCQSLPVSDLVPTVPDGERGSWIPQVIPIWMFFLLGERTALTCSPEGAGTWWFLILGKWEIDVKKQTPSPHWNKYWQMIQTDLFSCKIFAVLFAICYRVLKIVFLLKLLAKLSSVGINCRWMLVSFLVVTPCGSSQTLQTVPKFSLCSGLCSVWSASCFFVPQFPSLSSADCNTCPAYFTRISKRLKQGCLVSPSPQIGFLNLKRV